MLKILLVSHTQQKVDSKSWYVGEGNVALSYVSSYTLQSLIVKAESKKDSISKIKPVVINNEEKNVSSFGYYIGGTFGIKGGKE